MNNSKVQWKHIMNESHLIGVEVNAILSSKENMDGIWGLHGIEKLKRSARDVCIITPVSNYWIYNTVETRFSIAFDYSRKYFKNKVCEEPE